jgi:hypothetical protein
MGLSVLELNMLWSRSLVLLPTVGALFLTGCYTPPPPPPAPPAIVPATPEQAMDIQAAIMKEFPNAHVGHVSAVDASSHMAAIVGIPISDVHEKDSIQFLDSKNFGIANGTVINADSSNPEFPTLVVEFEPTAAGRAPVAGDLAIYIPKQ